jgi:hypothetical protein
MRMHVGTGVVIYQKTCAQISQLGEILKSFRQ